MKSALIILAVAAVTAFGSLSYMNNEVNEAAAQSKALKAQPQTSVQEHINVSKSTEYCLQSCSNIPVQQTADREVLETVDTYLQVQ